MRPIGALLLAAIAATLSLTSSQTNFMWKDCGPDDRIMEINALDISPNPIVVGNGEEVITNFEINVKEPIGEGATLSLTIDRYVTLFEESFKIPVPCLFGFGSCTKTICDWFDALQTVICPLLESNGKPCSCLIEPHPYKGTNVTAKITIPSSVPKALLSIGNGQYEVEGKIKSKEGKVLGCFYAEAGVKIQV